MYLLDIMFLMLFQEGSLYCFLWKKINASKGEVKYLILEILHQLHTSTVLQKFSILLWKLELKHGEVVNA